MKSDSSVYSPAYESTLTHDFWRRFASSVSWGAILAGLSAALALQVLFMLLGSGLGFAMYSPLTDENPVADLGRGALIVEGISAVFSLWFGGWVAGYFTPGRIRASAWLHGFSVWCAVTIVGVLIVAMGAGWILGGLAEVVGGGLSAAGKPAAALAESGVDAAKDALKQSSDALTSFTNEAVSNRPADAATNGTIRARREVGLAVARFFNPAEVNQQAENRAALVKALVDNAGMKESDANQAVADWSASYDRLKADLAATKNAAEAKAREIADRTASDLAIYSLGAFVAFVLGALAAGCGGRHGAKCSLQCENAITA